MTQRALCQPHCWSASIRSVVLIRSPITASPLFSRPIRRFASTPVRQAPLADQRPSPSLSTPASRSPSSPSPSSPPASSRVYFLAKIKRNSASWTQEADALLLDLRAQGQTWARIGQALGKSRQACNRRFDAVLDPEKGAAFWTLEPKRNKTLQNLVAQGFGWKPIAARLGTNGYACEKQWRILEQERIASAGAAAATAPAAAAATAEQPGTGDLAGQDPMEQARAPTTGKTARRFTLADGQLLKNAVAEHGDQDWDLISDQVFDAMFSPTYLRRRYATLERTRKVWTEIQDQHLLSLTSRYFQRDQAPPSPATARSSLDTLSVNQWEAIARAIPGEHSPAECRERWLRMQLRTTGQGQQQQEEQQGQGQRRTRKNPLMSVSDADIRPSSDRESDSSDDGGRGGNGRDNHNRDDDGNRTKRPASHEKRVSWTPEQSKRLETIALSFKDNPSTGGAIQWDKVSEAMGKEFTKGQCKTRWARMGNRAKCTTTGPWENEEVEHLIQGICEFGDQWTKISQKWIPGRTPSFIQGKWKAVAAKLQKEMVIQRWSWSTACVETFGEPLGRPLGELPSRHPHLYTASRPIA
ncbi:hypothetical protein B0O80DRAFT_442931 [Mortierella sp. GBAus27b]|nr:hypothetical protein BGX31_003397 [Mortierella sp. GBA43]KAI8358998.1 hypothetical protein B0O80DRAFT_442931 [Mortierella sp. GBAus27b]